MIVGGVSYSYFVYNKDIGDVSLTAGEISINLSGVNGNQTMSNMIPMSDYEGMNSSSYFDFTVNATVDTERIYYEVYLLPDSGNTLDTSYLKTYLTDQSNNVINDVTIYDDLGASEVANGKGIYRGVIEVNNNGTTKTETKAFRLRLWIDENYTETTSKTFDFDICLYAKNVDADFIVPIDPCPGCKYIYSNDFMYTTWNTRGETPTVLTAGLYDDFKELVTATGKNYFMAVKQNSSNEVTNAFACGIKGRVPFCVEGYRFDNPDASTIYSKTKALLQGSSLYNNTCTIENETYEIIRCGPWDNESLSVEVHDLGAVIVGIDYSNTVCAVSPDGLFVCL